MAGDTTELVDAAQRVAGLLAARSRDSVDDAATLLSTFTDDRELASGALALCRLLLDQHAAALSTTPEDVAQVLTHQLEQARIR